MMAQETRLRDNQPCRAAPGKDRQAGTVSLHVTFAGALAIAGISLEPASSFILAVLLSAIGLFALANTSRRDRGRLRLEPDQPHTFVYNGPIDILRKGQPLLQVVRLEDIPREHRLLKYINPKSDTRYYVIDEKNIKGLHFNKEVNLLGLRITRKGDKITITQLDPKSETHAEFTPAERETEPEHQLALKEFTDLEARSRSAASHPDDLPLIIAIQMELREKYEGLLEQVEIKSVLDRIQRLILEASHRTPSEPGATAAAQDRAPASAHETARRSAESDPAAAEILSLLRQALTLDKSGDAVRSREALEEADGLYVAWTEIEIEDRKERMEAFSAALEGDEEITGLLRDKGWPQLKLASNKLQEAEARQQEPLARKELEEIRDGFVELLERKLGDKQEIARAQKDYQALRQREKGLYVEMLMKPYGKYRSVNIWQSEYPESYREHMQGLSRLRDELIANKIKARKKLTSGPDPE